MGDCDLIHPSGKPEEGSAVDFVLDTVKENPGEIEIVEIGPSTNVALAIRKDPETMKKIWLPASGRITLRKRRNAMLSVARTKRTCRYTGR